MSKYGWGYVYVDYDRMPGFHRLSRGNTIEQETKHARKNNLIVELGPRMLALYRYPRGEMYVIYIHESLLLK